jgi:winged helix DNA-binding protein
VRHHLAGPARSDSVVEVAADLIALHATDPATVHLAALARMRDGTAATVERTLYDDRMLVRALGMRRTMFVLPRTCCRSCRRRVPTRSPPGSGDGPSSSCSRRASPPTSRWVLPLVAEAQAAKCR